MIFFLCLKKNKKERKILHLNSMAHNHIEEAFCLFYVTSKNDSQEKPCKWANQDIFTYLNTHTHIYIIHTRIL